MGSGDVLTKPLAGVMGIQNPGSGEIANMVYGPKTQKETDVGLEEYDPFSGKTTLLKPKLQRYKPEDIEAFLSQASSDQFNAEEVRKLATPVFEDAPLGVSQRVEEAFKEWLSVNESMKTTMADLSKAREAMPGRKSVLGAGGTVLG